MKAAEGFDKRLVSYARRWNLQGSYEQYLIYWMIAERLKPYAVHIATPCTELGVLGARQPVQVSLLCIKVTQEICEHQAAQGYLASIENPVGFELCKLPDWTEAFGGSFEPKKGWK